MSEVVGFFSLLQAGGNAAMIGLFFMMWRFDRRLIRIETTMDGHLRDEKYIHKVVDRVLGKNNARVVVPFPTRGKGRKK